MLQSIQMNQSLSPVGPSQSRTLAPITPRPQSDNHYLIAIVTFPNEPLPKRHVTSAAPAKLNQAFKRKYLELQSLRSTYQQLFEILQNRPPKEGEEILRHIQSGADVETVLTQVRDGDILLQLYLRASESE
ncbi:hypothetical protein HJFPF1_13607 [Paramyrothecium foliicola]|nr:hypothetical protein HJFPF1_13607 [Paramyrothecium foliicola]